MGYGHNGRVSSNISRVALGVGTDSSSSDEFVRSYTFGYPSVQRHQQIVVRIERSNIRFRCIVPETYWSRAARAVSHARHHEQPVETLNILGIRSTWIWAACKERCHLFVEVDGITRRNGRITPAVILDQLAAASPKSAQVGIV